MLADLKGKSCASLDKRRERAEILGFGGARRLPGGDLRNFAGRRRKTPSRSIPQCPTTQSQSFLDA